MRCPQCTKKTQNKREKEERKNSQPLMKETRQLPHTCLSSTLSKDRENRTNVQRIQSKTVNSKVTTMARSHPQDSYKSRAINSLSKSCLVFNQPKHEVYRKELRSVGIESHTRASEDATFMVQHRWSKFFLFMSFIIFFVVLGSNS